MLVEVEPGPAAAAARPTGRPREVPMTSCGILGWYDKGNIGDEAFKDAFAEAIRDVDPGRGEPAFHVNEAPAGPKLILGGGDVIRPYYLDLIAPEQRIVPIGVGLGFESEIELLRGRDVPFALFRNRRDVEL